LFKTMNGSLTKRVGYWTSVVAAGLGALYLILIIGSVFTGSFTFPPPEFVQYSAAIISLLFCPLLVIIMACVHTLAPAEKKVFSLSSFGMTVLFVASVSINRFVELGIIRQSLASGDVTGIEWFLPYGGHSVMFALEIMGWGWFLGLAMLLAAPLFAASKLELWIKWLMVSFGVLGILSALGQILASPLIMVGFVAWGLILFIIVALLAVYFRKS
jgi:hypothetical protein